MSNWWRTRFALALGLSLVVAGCGGGAPASAPAQPQSSAPTQSAEAKPAEQKPAAAQPAPTKAPDKLTVSYSSISGSMAVLWVAKEAKLFEKYGIDLEPVYISSSSKSTQALLAGDTPISQTAATGIIAAALEGADVTMIGSVVDTIVFSLMTRPEIKSINDLKGKKVGVSRLGASSDTSLRLFLKMNNLQPDKDVAVIQVGGIPEILAALKSGAIDGGMVSPPTTVAARKAGFTELVDLGTLGVKYAHTGLAANKTWLAKNKDLTDRFMKAYVEGLHMFKTKPDVAKQVISKYAQITDQEVLDDTWEVYAKKYMPEVPHSTAAGVKTILDELALKNPKAAAADPAKFVDDSFVQALEQSGFIKALYGK